MSLISNLFGAIKTLAIVGEKTCEELGENTCEDACEDGTRYGFSSNYSWYNPNNNDNDVNKFVLNFAPMRFIPQGYDGNIKGAGYHWMPFSKEDWIKKFKV